MVVFSQSVKPPADFERLLTLRTFGRTIVAMGKIRQTKKLVLPTPAEFGLLQILWRIGEGTIDEIVEASGQNPRPNYKTVQTLLLIMERKGQVAHSHQGRAFLFRPLVGHDEVLRYSVPAMLGNYFPASPATTFMS